MQDFLESEDFKVLAARDGAEAVQMHLRHKDEIAVVVLDLRLPKMNGLEAYLTMRSIQPNLKALFATGLPSPELEAELDKGVIEGIIMKPYQLYKVLEKISEILDPARATSRWRRLIFNNRNALESKLMPSLV